MIGIKSLALALAVIALAGWSYGQRAPRSGIDWEIVDVEGAEFVCFSNRRSALDCHSPLAALCTPTGPGEIVPPLGLTDVLAHPTPGSGIDWEIVDVEGAEFVCFTTRRGAISCQVSSCADWDPEGIGPRS